MARLKEVWKVFSPYSNMMRLFNWLGPRGTLMLICGLIWIQTGIGTLQGYSGSPTDAPHLLIPASIRGAMWIITGIVAIILCPTRSIPYHRIAVTALGVAPVVRLCSYLMSWIFSWSAFQALFPHFPLSGAPNAEYSSTFWQAELLLVIVLMIAPATWKMVRGYLLIEETGKYDRTKSGQSSNATTKEDGSGGSE